MTLSITHVVRQYAPSVGGLETVVARLAREQQHRFDHRVRVVTLDRVFTDRSHRLAAHDVIDGIAVTRLPWSGSPRYPICPRVLFAIRDADLVHVHAVDFFFDFLAATRWVHGKPLVASTHGGFFHTAFASRAKEVWFRTITRASALGFRRILATSRSDGETFERIAAPRVRVIENGAELASYRDAAAPLAVPVLLYFGRWSSNKGLPELVELLAALRARDPRFALIVAGRPYDLFRPDLERLATRHGCRDAVEIVESPDTGTLRKLMTRASYFACLSRHEGFGMAAIEAINAGLVPLLSDIPPFARIVDESGCGLVLRGADRGAWADAITALHALPPERRAADRARGITFSQRYDWSHVADRYDAEYRAALAVDASLPRSMPS